MPAATLVEGDFLTPGLTLLPNKRYILTAVTNGDGNARASMVEMTADSYCPFTLDASLVPCIHPGTFAGVLGDMVYTGASAEIATLTGNIAATKKFLSQTGNGSISAAPAWAAIAQADIANLASDLAAKAPLASPDLTGTPTAPTAAPGTDTGQIATTAFVKAAVDTVVSAAPGALDTLDELAAALGDDANFASTVTTALGGKEATANKDASGGYAGLTLLKINFRNVADTFTSFLTNSNSEARTYAFQNRNGTIADDTDLAAKAPLASPTFTGTVGGITAAMVGLGNVENTALSTWTGGTGITTVGTITTGTWNSSSIAYNKLTLTGSVTNADLAGSIAYSKLNLTGSVVSADIVSLAFSKLTATPSTLSGYGILDALANPMTTLGDVIYGLNTGTPQRLAGNITASRKFFTQTGTGSESAAPSWEFLGVSDLPGSIPASKLVGTDITTVGTVTTGTWQGGIIASNYGGTGNGFTKFSGPTTAEKTKTLRDANDTILELGGNYTPTGTWTSLTLVTPSLGTPASGNLANCSFPTLNQSTTGSAATLTTPRNINGVAFNGSADITVAAAAGTLTGTTLAAAVATSSLTTIGALIAGAVPTSLLTGTVSNAQITNSAVTLGKMADVATATVFYRKTAGTGAPEVQTLATLKTDLGLTGTNSGDQTITLTGDVTGSGTGSFAATVTTQMSVTRDGSGVKLVNDSAAPGNSRYYGTDSGGTKGFFALPVGGGTAGTTTVDFGAWPGATDASVAVTGQTTIGANSIILTKIRLAATADHTADEHFVEEMEVAAGNISAGVGFTVYARSRQNLRLYGQWEIDWSWS